MAITLSTDRLDGLQGVTVGGIYARIQSVTVKNYDSGGGSEGTDPMYKLLYDVVLFASASVRQAPGESPEWRNRMRSRQIDHFTCEISLADLSAAGANPYTMAYANLKSRLAKNDGGESPTRDSPAIATEITDA